MLKTAAIVLIFLFMGAFLFAAGCAIFTVIIPNGIRKLKKP